MDGINLAALENYFFLKKTVIHGHTKRQVVQIFSTNLPTTKLAFRTMLIYVGSLDGEHPAEVLLLLSLQLVPCAQMSREIGSFRQIFVMVVCPRNSLDPHYLVPH